MVNLLVVLWQRDEQYNLYLGHPRNLSDDSDIQYEPYLSKLEHQHSGLQKNTSKFPYSVPANVQRR